MSEKEAEDSANQVYLYLLLFLIAEEVLLIETSFCVHFLNKKMKMYYISQNLLL